DGVLLGASAVYQARRAVVVDVRRLQADARELAEQVRLLGGQARAAEDCDAAWAVFGLQPVDGARRPRDRIGIGKRREPAGRGRVARKRRDETIGMRSLEIALHAFRAEHAAVEREVHPRLEADHLVVLDLELNAALLAAEAAVRLDESVGLGAGREALARHAREVRSEPIDDLKGVRRNRGHYRTCSPGETRQRAPWASPASARRHAGHIS